MNVVATYRYGRLNESVKKITAATPTSKFPTHYSHIERTNMKLIISAIVAAVFATAAFAAPVIVDGCEIVTAPGASFSIKADPSCVFASVDVQDDFTKDFTDLDFAK